MVDPIVFEKKLHHIEEKYEQLECINRGAFSSIYLAQERGMGRRMVAIKSVRVCNEDRKKAYLREVQSLRCLNNQSDEQKHRDFAVICFHEHFALENSTSAFIVTNYVTGGTLAEWTEKQQRNTTEGCSERRLAWYILQVCEAIAYIHERGIPYYDLNPQSILMDCKDGGKLVLTDFGSSVNPLYVDSEDFIVHYESPELLEARRSSDPSKDHRRIDVTAMESFSIGCLALELLSGTSISKMKGLHGRSLGDFLVQNGSLSELEPKLNDDSNYSALLRNDVVSQLLNPDPTKRVKSSYFPHALRKDSRSPLLTPTVEASHPALYRHHVTIDNISLGLFVQRGPDWKFGDESDGGEGSVGVITALDPDALYTTVMWSTGHCDVYRIGAKNKMEIVVGPPVFNDKPSGLVITKDASKYAVGYPYNVAPNDKLDRGTGGLLVAHIETLFPTDSQSDLVCVVPQLTRQFPNSHRFLPQILHVARGPHNRTITPHDPEPVPSYWSKVPPQSWNPGTTRLCTVENREERDWVVGTSYGLLSLGYQIVNIQRVQSERLWTAYARRREEIALENWGYANEMRLFHGTSSVEPDRIVNDPVGFDPRFCDRGTFGRGSYFAVNPEYSDAYRYPLPNSSGTFQMFLARVALGRVQHVSTYSANIRRPDLGCHSVKGVSMNHKRHQSEIFITYDTDTQAYPEYLITYAKG
jgi:serine/threonine protein kinase